MVQLHNAEKQNRDIIVASKVPFTDHGVTLQFRGNKWADFYPSTGRWRACNTMKVYNGGARKFLAWYRR